MSIEYSEYEPSPNNGRVVPCRECHFYDTDTLGNCALSEEEREELSKFNGYNCQSGGKVWKRVEGTYMDKKGTYTDKNRILRRIVEII